MKLLVTGAFAWKKEYMDILADMGIEVVYSEREDSELSQEAKTADAVICNWLFVHHDIDDFKNLKYIQLLSAGLDRIPLDRINERGITVRNARGVYSIPMAEFAVSGVLELMKHKAFFCGNKKAHMWEKKRDLDELFGKNVLIVGCGSVGSETAKRFSAFTDEVYGVDLYPPKEFSWYKDIRPLSELDAMLEKADVAVLTLPLTNETFHLFDRERMLSMKKGAVLVNIARGSVIDEKAVPEVMSHLGGLVADTFEKEPLPADSPLWELENAVITPHNSFASNANQERMWDVCLKNITEYLKTENC
ncbi:MAG: hydroxyacid dehydrogenase [Ruminococcus sp.]|nr:hydroxyacid dehydrogenase [Ruminococcus sp.]